MVGCEEMRNFCFCGSDSCRNFQHKDLRYLHDRLRMVEFENKILIAKVREKELSDSQTRQ